MNKYINIFVGIIEIAMFYLLLGIVDETVVFNSCAFILTFACGFVIGINKSGFKYFYPLLISYTFFLGINSSVELLFIQYLIFGYLGVFTSTFINMLRRKRHLKYPAKVSLAVMSIFILVALFVGTNIA